jgi:hypothetical protein
VGISCEQNKVTLCNAFHEVLKQMYFRHLLGDFVSLKRYLGSVEGASTFCIKLARPRELFLGLSIEVLVFGYEGIGL